MQNKKLYDQVLCLLEFCKIKNYINLDEGVLDGIGETLEFLIKD